VSPKLYARKGAKFIMATLKVQSSSKRTLSTIKRVPATPEKREAFEASYREFLPKGFAIPTYYADWQDYALMGAISVIAFLRWVGGDKQMGYEQAHKVGVRVRSGTIKKYGEDSIGSAKLDTSNVEAWLKATPAEREKQLKAAGLV
jgi:hypothetical protein